MSAPPSGQTGAIMRQIQTTARTSGRTTQELLTLYGLERFLERLTRSAHRDAFVLKGGVLLAAYRLRRPTRDIDLQVVDEALDAAFLEQVVTEVAAVPAQDGLVFDPASLTVRPIREGAPYQGLRAKFSAALGRTRIFVQADVSTGDPITPAPQEVLMEGVLPGTSFTISGHPLVTVIAEKTITMVERGAASTRWRDFLDVRSISMLHPVRETELHEAVHAVAEHRGVDVLPVASMDPPFDAEAQRQWSAWRTDQQVEDRCLPVLVDQIAEVAEFIDPVFTDSATGQGWSPAARRWQ